MATVSGLELWFSLCLGIVVGQQQSTVKSHRVAQILAATVEYHIKDELPADTTIGSIPTDGGLDLRYSSETLNQLRYSFLAHSENPYLHLQEDTGVIHTAQTIDRDQVCSEISSCYMQLHVLVQPIFQMITVKVEVTDINDNVPVFPVNEVSHVIAESASLGTTIGIPSAQDQDSSEYRIKCYELLPAKEDAFALKVTHLLDGSTHLELVLLETLDAEKQDSYQLEVVASDGGDPPKSGSLIINIKVNRAADNSTLSESDNNDVLGGTETTRPLPIDLSNHDLRFEKDSYELDIEEDASAGIIANVSVLGDYPFGHITYLFERLISYFAIDYNTGVIYLNYQLNYEYRSSYELTVVAVRNTSGTLTLARASLSVHVLDVNDNSPLISFPNLYGSYGKVYENEMIGTIVQDVKVTDRDSGENGKVECSVNSTDFKLEKISETEYKLVTALTLDRESKDNHSLQISCEDSGDVPRKTDRIIRVLVLDRNDNAPQFTSSLYSAEINDFESYRSFELSVSANDPDNHYNGRILYRIDGESKAFQIDEETGVIRPYVDDNYYGYSFEDQYEYLSTMMLHIIASDRGNPALSSTTSVYISVHNDPPPVFRPEHYAFSIYENQMPGSLVGTATAYVRDLPPYSKVEYKLGDDHASSSFAINPNTGEITSVKVLDREIAEVYYFNVTAINEAHGRKQNSTATVSVVVEDENDNMPVIEFPTEIHNNITISSSVPIGHEVFQILAHDDDAFQNADLVYSFAENYDLFEVNSVTGAVYTTMSFLSSHKNTSHHVIVKVADKGQPSRVTLAEVTINII